jgi:cupin superfamily protein
LDALDLLSGDGRAFLEHTWASRIHLHQADRRQVVDLLSLRDADALILGTAMRIPALRVAKDGTVLPSSAFTRSATIAGTAMTGLVDPRKISELFANGATLVLQGLHRYWPPLTELIRDLERSLGHPCQANAYLTPPGAQGFAKHSDTHDVFVFQTHGAKEWEVEDHGTTHSMVMKPGTCLYLPAGTPHAARTQDIASLHVTVGINQIQWRDVLERAVASAIAQPVHDGRIPAGYLDEPADFARQLSTHLRSLANAIDGLDPVALASAQAARFMTTRPAALQGMILDSLALAEVDDDTVVRRRVGSWATIQLDNDGERVRLRLGDRELLLPSRTKEPLEHLIRRSEFRPRDLAPWLDASSRLVLVRRLVREGLLSLESVRQVP